MEASSALGEAKLPLLGNNIDEHERVALVKRVWNESKKLWHIAGPSIFNRVSNYTMLVMTQIFAGRIGDAELAATAIAINVILGLDFGIMVKLKFLFHLKLHLRYIVINYNYLSFYCNHTQSWMMVPFMFEAFTRKNKISF